jgi:hypothetical protein
LRIFLLFALAFCSNLLVICSWGDVDSCASKQEVIQIPLFVRSTIFIKEFREGRKKLVVDNKKDPTYKSDMMY